MSRDSEQQTSKRGDKHGSAKYSRDYADERDRRTEQDVLNEVLPSVIGPETTHKVHRYRE